MNRTAIPAAIGSALSLCLTVATTPAAAQLSPSGPESRSRAFLPNEQLLVSGAAIVAAAYAPSFAVAATSDRGGDKWLYAPFVGPWADLGSREGCGVSGGDCSNEDLYKLLLVSAGVAQTVGLVGIISSFIVPEYRADRSVAQSVKPEVRVSPMRLTQDGYGVGAVGRF